MRYVSLSLSLWWEIKKLLSQILEVAWGRKNGTFCKLMKAVVSCTAHRPWVFPCKKRSSPAVSWAPVMLPFGTAGCCCGLCSFHTGCEYGHARFFLSNVLRKQRAKLRRRWFFGFGVSFADRWLAGQVVCRSGDSLHKELHFYHIRNRSQDIKPECCISLYFAPTWPSFICSWFSWGVIELGLSGPGPMLYCNWQHPEFPF